MRVCGVLLSLLLSASAWAESWSLRVEPEPVRQGGLVFLELEGQGELEQPTCEWLGRTYPLYSGPHGYRVVLPVDRLERIGPADLFVRAAGHTAPLAHRTLSIVGLNTGPIEIIRLTPDRMALQRDPRLKEESKLISEILRTKSAGQLWKGNFQTPTNGAGSGYGKQRRYIEVRRGRKRSSSFMGYHRGLDYSHEPGTPIRAAQAGKVLAARPFVLPGNAVFLDHGQGLITSYFHMQEIKVKAGDLVAQGDVLGTVGSTGRSTGPHLHWSVYAQGHAVNPAAITNIPERFRE